MAKIVIKSDTFTPFGGLFFVYDQFKHLIMPYVDRYLGRRTLLIGYKYSDIVCAMACNFFCGGNRTEDINVLKNKVSEYPELHICSPDTVLRTLSQLAEEDLVYTAANGSAYRFNTAERLNALLIYTGIMNGSLDPSHKFDFDFDHEFIESETWDSTYTYKGFSGYGPGCAVLTDVKTGFDYIAGIENRDGNTPVKFHQEDTLERILLNIIEQGIKIRCARVDCGSYTEKVISLLLEHSERIFVRAAMNKKLRSQLQSPHRQWLSTTVGDQQMEVTSLPFDGLGENIKHCRLVVQRQRRKEGSQLDMFSEGGDDINVYRAILTNDWDMTEEEVISFYNQRGAKEKIFDQMDNDFGWHYLPKGLLKENTVFMLLTALIRNFYVLLLQNDRLRAFGVYAKTRMKTFINRVVSVVAKWTKGGRRKILTIYTDVEHVNAYSNLFADYG